MPEICVKFYTFVLENEIKAIQYAVLILFYSKIYLFFPLTLFVEISYLISLKI